MKNEKKASVLSTSQYSTSDELTLYSDKTIKAKKQHNATQKPSYIESISYSSDSKLNQFGSISYDLNTLDIDLNIRTNSLTPDDENLDYGNTSEHFQALNGRYDFDCTYSTGTSEIQAVADMILKSKLSWLTFLAQFFLTRISILGTYEEKCKLTDEGTYSNQDNVGYSYSTSCNKILTSESQGQAYIEDSCNTKNMCLYKDISNYDICKPVEAHDETHEFLNQVDNNNFNIAYSSQAEAQYASCSNHNISMISSACYSNATAVSYSNVSYNAVYPIKDVNKNYEEVSW